MDQTQPLIVPKTFQFFSQGNTLDLILSIIFEMVSRTNFLRIQQENVYVLSGLKRMCVCVCLCVRIRTSKPNATFKTRHKKLYTYFAVHSVPKQFYNSLFRFSVCASSMFYSMSLVSFLFKLNLDSIFYVAQIIQSQF